ncbi:MAG: hypothetical protein ABWZ57_04330 [Mesorhizobium sp.]
MPLNPQLRDTLEEFRGMLRRISVKARSTNFERMVYALDLALFELAGRQRGADEDVALPESARPKCPAHAPSAAEAMDETQLDDDVRPPLCQAATGEPEPATRH